MDIPWLTHGLTFAAGCLAGGVGIAICCGGRTVRARPAPAPLRGWDAALAGCERTPIPAVPPHVQDLPAALARALAGRPDTAGGQALGECPWPAEARPAAGGVAPLSDVDD